MNYIGRRTRALDWDNRTSGRAIYAGDLRFEGLLTGKILRSPHPHARVLAIDTSAARSMPGVHAVVTAADLPAGARYMHEGASDRPPLADGAVRFIGQEVAAVAAESAAQAEAALRAIRVHYEVLPAPLNTDEALAPCAVRLHDRAASKDSAVGNVSRRFKRHWGDPASGRAASSHSVEGSFHYQRVAHACMEQHTTVAEWDAAQSRLHLWTSTQAPHFIVKEVSQVLGLRADQVVCHEIAVGGGFGAKSKICEHEAIAALLARCALRPVRLTLTREEEFATTKSRHAFAVQLQLHADTEGRLRAIDGDVIVDNGAYNHSGVSVMAAGLKAFGQLYRPDGIEADARLVDTAVLPGGQFRGYGSTQTGFALECLIDELAERIGCDPLELRLRNANQPGERTLVGAKLTSVRLAECLEAVRDAIGWKEEKANRRPGRGVGVSSGVHASGAFSNPGANRSDAAIDIHADGRVRIRFGGADAGTGQKTILAQIAAQELGVDIGNVEVLSMDSEKTPFDMGAWSSRGTHYSGHAMRLAATDTVTRLRALATQVFANQPVRFEDGMVRGGDREIALGELAMLSPEAVDGMLTTESSYVETKVEQSDPNTGIGNFSASYNFAAHAAVVDVDRRTGEVRVLDYVAAHDIGTAINPTFAEGQIVGGVAMGIGAALSEELIFEQGKLVNQAFLHYALPRAADLPRIRPILVEGGDANGPYGAKGTGELGVNPPGSVIANAVYDAIGVRIRDLPITPDKVLVALAEKEGRRRRHNLWRRPSRWWIQLVRWAYPRGLFKILHRRATRHTIGDASYAPAQVAAPATLDEAIQSLGRDAMVMAGGTDVQLQRRQGLATPVRLISLLDVRGLNAINIADDGSVLLGASATLAQVSAALAAHMPVVAEAIDSIANSQIRAMATVGGNLLQAKRCWFYRNDFPCYKRMGGVAPCYAIEGDHRFYHAAIDGHRCQAVTPSDLATVLTALDAVAVIKGPAGQREVPLAALYTGPGEADLREGELLTQVRIPAGGKSRRAAFEKLRLWEGDFALVSVAIAADIDGDGRCRNPRVILGALAPTPWRARRTEQALEGAMMTPAATAVLRTALDQELDAMAHPLRRNGWKLDAVAGLAERVLERLQSPAPGSRVDAGREDAGREDVLAAAPVN